MRHVKMYTWHKIAAELNGTPDQVRKAHDRFLKRRNDD